MYVPTPLEVVDRLRSCLMLPEGVHALDPCCGDGAALAALNPSGVNYGVELELQRADDAHESLDRVVNCAFQDIRMESPQFGLILLNPPYDASSHGRLERVFLDRCSRLLEAGGVLVLIIKESMYSEVVRRLLRDFEPLAHWRFPAPFYDGPDLAFKQTCLVARKLPRPNIVNDTDVGVFMRTKLSIGSLGPMPAGMSPHIPVPVGQDPGIFASGMLTKEDVVRLFETSPLRRFPVAAKRMRSRGRPPLPLKKGHVSLVLASGHADGLMGSGESLHVAKGMVIRRTKTEWKPDTTQGGKAAAIKVSTDFFSVAIRALRPDGSLITLVSTAGQGSVTEDGVEDGDD